MSKVVQFKRAPKVVLPRYRILHCLRAPVGGLFRHVRDLAREQAALGHEVGVLCDKNAMDPLTEARLAELASSLALGLHKVAMSREIGFADISAARSTRRLAEHLKVDVIHGHGAKGGAYARIAARALKGQGLAVASFYTSHGGSLHYDPASLKGRAFMAAERHLLGITDGLIFESKYAADTFAAKVGTPACPSRIIHNGILPDEIRKLEPSPDAADFLFVGELRQLKGVDVLLDAIADIAKSRSVTAAIVGAGPDEAQFKAQAERLGLSQNVRFLGAMPAREAFRLGHIMVMPSRAESMPYIVLEAAGAGLPLIATHVGGIPEVVAGTDTELVPPDDAAALSRAMLKSLDGAIHAADRAGRLQRAIAERFSVGNMVEGIVAFYAEALTLRVNAAGAAAG